jgi:hypothetical protein
MRQKRYIEGDEILVDWGSGKDRCIFVQTGAGKFHLLEKLTWNRLRDKQLGDTNRDGRPHGVTISDLKREFPKHYRFFDDVTKEELLPPNICSLCSQEIKEEEL